MPQFNGHNVVTIQNQSTRASFIPERGGVGFSIIMLGKQGPRELLFLHSYIWQQQWPDLPGGWPFLFPVCARLQRDQQPGAYLYDGKIYQLPIHGFSWQQAWQVEHSQQDRLIMSLTENAQTLAMYPFRFKVTLDYLVEPNKLICKQTYQNNSDVPMPYYAGFHPYFLTPAPGQGKEQVMLDYEPVRRLQYNPSLTDIIGEQSLFDVPTAITNPDINEQLTQVSENKECHLIYPDGDRISLQATGKNDLDLFSYVQLYTIPEQSFFCVEPWMAYPNAMNAVQGVRWLVPGAKEHGSLTLELI